eukprot:6191878-Pleurochrysis_carterae.AAC.1
MSDFIEQFALNIDLDAIVIFAEKTISVPRKNGCRALAQGRAQDIGKSAAACFNVQSLHTGIAVPLKVFGMALNAMLSLLSIAVGTLARISLYTVYGSGMYLGNTKMFYYSTYGELTLRVSDCNSISRALCLFAYMSVLLVAQAGVEARSILIACWASARAVKPFVCDSVSRCTDRSAVRFQTHYVTYWNLQAAYQL